MLPRGAMIWNLGRASQRSDGLESWTCFPEVHGFEFGRASQRSMDLNLDVLPRSLDVLPRGPMDWNLGRAS